MRALRRSHTSTSSPNSSPPPSTSSSSSSSWIHLRSVLFVVNSSSPAYCSSSDRGRLKSPWYRRKRKQALSPQQWRSLFLPDGKLSDGGIKFLKRVRSGGVDPSIRAEVWPFLLGVYDIDSPIEETEIIRSQKRKEYKKLRKQCCQLLSCSDESFKLNEIGEMNYEGDSGSVVQAYEAVVGARESPLGDERSPDVEYSDDPSSALLEGYDSSTQGKNTAASALNSESSDSDSSEDTEIIQASSLPEGREENGPDDPEVIQAASLSEGREENDPDDPEVIQASSLTEGTAENDADAPSKEDISPSRTEPHSKLCTKENFATWQRIIRVDAVRANSEWIPYSPSQAAVSEDKAHRYAQAVGLKDYDHLEPCRIFHAARLVAILEAYALYDPEIGYCQGMSDLLSPIVAVITEDQEAFWCFVAFMRKARHNFRLDEVGIRRQLNIVSKIIKSKDSHLYRHLEKLEAEDCFFVYRMVVVLFRRELTFEQTICLWEVIWADQAAIRVGIGKSTWSRIRQRAPPTDDLLLYAIAASVLQRRKLIIEKYSSMDEILRECNSMAGHLDVWKLLDDAHDLVVTLHDKIETSL